MRIPDRCGLVVRIDTAQSKYPEIWIASNINGGRWYADAESWAMGARGPLDDGGAHVDHLTERGTVTLLTGASQEAYEAGWRACAAAMSQAVDEIEGDCPAGGS